MVEISAAERAAGWTDISGGHISRNKLEEWVREYFGSDVDLSNFVRRNDQRGFGLELRDEDSSKGYVFAGPLQLDRDYVKRMEGTKLLYASEDGFEITREFIDHEDEIAGFTWRKK